jgi:hypothetical protein
MSYAERWHEVTKGHYLEDKVHPRGSMAGLAEVLTLLTEHLGSGEYHAEHDILCLGPSYALQAPPELPEGVMVRLAQLGVHWDSELECFAIFC